MRRLRCQSAPLSGMTLRPSRMALSALLLALKACLAEQLTWCIRCRGLHATAAGQRGPIAGSNRGVQSQVLVARRGSAPCGRPGRAEDPALEGLERIFGHHRGPGAPRSRRCESHCS